MGNRFKKALEEEKRVERVEDKVETKQEDQDIKESKSIEKGSFDVEQFITSKSRKSTAKTYYLEEDVIKEISRLAKKSGLSDSRVLNDILKGVLEISN